MPEGWINRSRKSRVSRQPSTNHLLQLTYLRLEACLTPLCLIFQERFLPLSLRDTLKMAYAFHLLQSNSGIHHLSSHTQHKTPKVLPAADGGVFQKSHRGVCRNIHTLGKRTVKEVEGVRGGEQELQETDQASQVPLREVRQEPEWAQPEVTVCPPTPHLKTLTP